MPSFDKTGPDGKGSGTGQGHGSCMENQQKPPRGRGFECCRNGGGRGLFFKKSKSISLDDQEKNLEKRLEEVCGAKKSTKL